MPINFNLGLHTNYKLIDAIKLSLWKAGCEIFCRILKFRYFEKVTKFCEISTLLLTESELRSKGDISQNFVAFSEYVNFKIDVVLQIPQVPFRVELACKNLILI